MTVGPVEPGAGSGASGPVEPGAGSPRQPVADRRPAPRTFHGDTVVDDYAWLADTSAPEVIDYLEQHNAFTAAATADQALLRENVYSEIKSHTQETDMSVPVRRNGFWYYGRSIEGQQYGVQCRAPISGEDDWNPPTLSDDPLPGEIVMLDLNAEAEGHEFLSVGAAAVSPDGRLLAYSLDVTGDERYTLRVKDIEGGELLADVVENVFAGVCWAPDSRHLFYTTPDEAWRPDRVWRHEIGSGSSDVEVYHETDQRFGVSVGLTRSHRFLVLASSSTLTSEMRVLDASDPTGEFSIVRPREEGVEYSVDHAVLAGADRFLVLHNRAGINFELATAPVDEPSEWTVLVPHRDDVRLLDVDVFARRLVLEYRRAGLPRIAFGTTELEPVFSEWDPGEELASVGLAGNPEWDAPRLRVGYESFVNPATILDLEPATGEQTVLKRQPVPGYDPDRYVAERVWVTARDGEQVPVSIVRRSDGAADANAAGGPAPTLLYGYGSYEACMDPWFSVARLSLLDRGVVFAVAHVRGGGELGRRWYDDGKMLRKNNTFTDFVDAARHLVDTGRAAPDRLVAMGGSAGGLLVGAVANLAPELFCGVVADVPFVDPLTSILDPELPLTVGEWEEWGNPLEDPDVYRYMRGYSPYENVRDAAYPAMLVTTSLNDTRVLPTEPAKWVAKLLAHTTSGEQILLKTEMSAGHGGVSGRYRAWEETAFEYSWILGRLGCA
ncbi:S9 family peptidase [Tsukamurella sp. 8F]|uniref:S9 family peptidase n=1 Tax=unclassified Tsukamurella TaxID=2633480 RepID=UPI0023BA303A|nr:MULTISPECIES: S9 family peptidase [unclassified Tsukamurella]MDF0528352.1 S9 family peptidase [Tsukamurella sp. 8J]MDF0586177.1 S9 family peptidase [Tsukamurella sp. 8F]